MSDIKGLDRLLSKLDSLGDNSVEIMEKGIKSGLKIVQKSAKDLCPVDNGELRNSIATTSTKEDNRAEGAVFTNKEYAPYVEFGTGPVGEASRKDIPPDLQLNYKQEGWFIPIGDGEGQLSLATAQKYHFPIIGREGEQQFAFTNGQEPQPFLYPALKSNEKRVKEAIVKTALNEIIKAVKKNE